MALSLSRHQLKNDGDRPNVARDRTVLFETVRLTKAFGGVVAVNHVDLTVSKGEIVAIIGPNGAGKTTLFNLMTGVLKPTSGKIFFKGMSIGGKPPHLISSLGIARTFQNLQIFGNMTVLENVMVGCHLKGRFGMLASAFRIPGERAEEHAISKLAWGKLELVGLSDQANFPATALSFGQQRLLEIARALALEPEVLLLDEPVAGLGREEANGLMDLIFKLRDSGVTILLVEHDMETVMGVADRIVVLDGGDKIAEGTPSEIQMDERVITAYLGSEEF